MSLEQIGFWGAAITTIFVVIAFFWAVFTVIKFFIGIITGNTTLLDAVLSPFVIAGFIRFVTFLMILLAIVFTPLGLILFLAVGLTMDFLGCN